MNHLKAKQVLITTLILNWLVAIAKIYIGFVTGALSILTDGFHSLFDGTSNVLGLIGIKLAERPGDKDHPYGHRKFESIAAMGIVVLLVITAYEFLKNTIGRIIHPAEPEITTLSFLVMTSTLAIDYFVYRYESFWGNRIKNQILIADSAHTKTHLFITPAVLIAMVATKAGFPIADPLIALLIIFFLGKLAWEVSGEITATLCDQAAVDIKDIEKIISSVPSINSSHQIRTRGDSHHVFLDMHITIDPKLSLGEAHDISHRLKEKIIEEIPQIKDVVIHMEPTDKK